MKIYLKLCLLFLSLMLTGASALANETPSKILITNVHIFDGISDQRLMNANLLVEGKIIKKISARVISIEPGHLLSEKTLRLMKEKDAYLSMQPILDDDVIQFPQGHSVE